MPRPSKKRTKRLTFSSFSGTRTACIVGIVIWTGEPSVALACLRSQLPAFSQERVVTAPFPARHIGIGTGACESLQCASVESSQHERPALTICREKGAVLCHSWEFRRRQGLHAGKFRVHEDAVAKIGYRGLNRLLSLGQHTMPLALLTLWAAPNAEKAEEAECQEDIWPAILSRSLSSRSRLRRTSQRT